MTAPIGTGRDRSRDGLRNKIEDLVLNHGRPFWAFVNAQPWLARWFNGIIVNMAVGKAPFRPLGLSTRSPYASWSSLTDKRWFSRYLPAKPNPDVPALERLAPLYVTRASGPRVSTKSTLLFPSFAQWFTDGFLMTDPTCTRKTHTNHQIDLCQIYGLNETMTAALRERDPPAGRRGRLLSQIVDGEEWAPFLFDETGKRVARFADVPDPLKMPDNLPLGRKTRLFAFGGERANSTTFTAAINTLFLREHNRLCGVIEKANPGFDDDRVFETARNIGIVQLIKIVIEEYINHIKPYWFKLLSDPTPCYKAEWNRENWIPVEFNLLYRWHSLVPEQAVWGGTPVDMAGLRFGNEPLVRDGLGAALAAASASPVWQIGLFNTSSMLRPVELASVQQGRDNQLDSYNAYRERMKFPRVTRFEQISGDPDVVAALRALYDGDVDKIEFFVGLFAEDAPERSSVPPLIGRMVAVDAFSHALTNPLLAPRVYNEATFTAEGLRSIEATSTLADLAKRNKCGGGLRISMEQTTHVGVA